MIPKKIHYVWLGDNKLSPLNISCMKTWSEYNPDFEVVRWDESNSPMESGYVKQAIKQKKYAFASDYIRFFVLFNYGGIYLDTDMEVIKPLDDFLENDFFAGYESENWINCSIFGADKGSDVCKEVLNVLDALGEKNIKEFEPIPKILTRVINGNHFNDTAKIYNQKVFYPFNPYSSDIKQMLYKDVTSDTFALHHWEKTWKPTLLEKALRRIRLYLQTDNYICKDFSLMLGAEYLLVQLLYLLFPLSALVVVYISAENQQQ